MESFAFGVANPSQISVDKAEEILHTIEVKKLRDKLLELVTSPRTGPLVYKFDITTRVVIDNFLFRVKPDKIPPEEFTKLNQVICKLQGDKFIEPPVTVS